MMSDLPDASDMGALMDQLHAMGSRPKGKVCHCPNHEDKNPSASILSDATGHCRVFCHTCNEAWDVYDLRAMATGRPVAEVLRDDRPVTVRPARRPTPAPVEGAPLILADKLAVKAYCERIGTPTNWYTYGPKDAPALIVCRIQVGAKKTFRQFTPTPTGYAAKNLREKGTLPLYRLDEALHLDHLLVVEGEKSADAAWSVGIPAVTSAMGADKWNWSNWATIVPREVTLWPDHDESGRRHMTGLGEHLTALGCKVHMIDPDGIGLEPGGDIADLTAAWTNAGQPPAEQQRMVRALMGDASDTGAAATVEAWHQEVLAGRWRNLDWPLPALGRLSRATMPGCLALVCADPGAGKSWLMLQCMRHWNAAGSRTVVRMLEDDLRAHCTRLLAMMSGEGGHTDDAWVAENPNTVASDLAQHRAELDQLGACIVPESRDLLTHAGLVAWVEAQAKAGARCIAVDPITAVKSGKEPWLDDFSSAMKLKDIATAYGCSILITTHPRSTTREPSLAGMAGGSAWSRFAHTVLWLAREKDGSTVTLANGDQHAVNRSVHILKSRHGKGAGSRMGLEWTDQCRFREVGLHVETAQPDDEKHKRKPRNRAPKSDSEDQFNVP